MIDSDIQIISVLIILLALFVIALLSRRRRRPFLIREIAAYRLMPSFVGLAIESNRPMHISLGSVGLGGQSTILAVASAELAYRMAQRASIGDVSPILTLSEASALPLGQDALRRAYQSRGFNSRYRPNSVRWYPAGGRSMAFAAAITTLMSADDVSSNLFVGSFGPELSLMMDAGARRGLPMIAVSDQVEGQAVAFAMSDEPLIGEELFQADAYLSGENAQTNEAATVDTLRWLLVLALVAGFVLAFLNRGG